MASCGPAKTSKQNKVRFRRLNPTPRARGRKHVVDIIKRHVRKKFFLEVGVGDEMNSRDRVTSYCDRNFDGILILAVIDLNAQLPSGDADPQHCTSL
jgi:hypothetical protein